MQLFSYFGFSFFFPIKKNTKLQRLRNKSFLFFQNTQTELEYYPYKKICGDLGNIPYLWSNRITCPDISQFLDWRFYQTFPTAIIFKLSTAISRVNRIYSSSPFSHDSFWWETCLAGPREHDGHESLPLIEADDIQSTPITWLMARVSLISSLFFECLYVCSSESGMIGILLAVITMNYGRFSDIYNTPFPSRAS